MMITELFEKTFISLRHKNFRLFFTGQTISLIGTWMHQTAMGWLVYQMTGSKLLLGTIASLGALPMLFFSIFGGVIADRFSKRKVIITTQSVSMILTGIIAGLVLFNICRIWHIVLISVMLGTVLAVDMPVRQSFLIDIAGRKDLMNAIALNSSMVNLAKVIGPAIAGVIMLKWGISWCFILNSLSFIAVLISLFNLNLVEPQLKTRSESIFQYTISGFNYVKGNKTILNAMILMGLMGFFGLSYAVLLPAFAKDVLLQNEKGYAMLVSSNGIGALIGALIVANLGDSRNKRKIMDFSIYLFSLMLFLLTLNKNYIISLILLIVAGIGAMTYFSSSTTLIQSHVDDEVRGRVMGIWTLLFGGIIPLGSLFAGTTAQFFGLSGTLMISSIICPIFTLILAKNAKCCSQDSNENNLTTKPQELLPISK